MTINVIITTCNRHGQCQKLIDRLQADNRFVGFALNIIVQDDSDQPQRIEGANVFWAANPSRLGKAGYWRTCNAIWDRSAMHPCDYVVMMPDDSMPRNNSFLAHLVDILSSAPSRRATWINIERDWSRRSRPCWTNFQPVEGGSLIQTQWLDCAFATTPEALARVRMTQPTPEMLRRRSSSVGNQMTGQINAQGGAIYQVRHSMLLPSETAFESLLNPDRPQLENELVTRTVLVGDHIRCQIASVPARVNCLRRTLESLYDQADTIFVALNGYRQVPEFLARMGEGGRVRYRLMDNAWSRGDAAKFFGVEWLPQETYVLTCDDDLVYPPGYVAKMVQAVDFYQREAAVSLHGRKYAELPVADWRHQECEHVHCLNELLTDRPMDVIGTGCLAFHKSALRIRHNDFERPNMADIYFTALAARQGVKLFAIAHGAKWLKYQLVESAPTIWTQTDHAEVLEQSRILSDALASARSVLPNEMVR